METDEKFCIFKEAMKNYQLKQKYKVNLSIFSKPFSKVKVYGVRHTLFPPISPVSVRHVEYAFGHRMVKACRTLSTTYYTCAS